MLLSMFGFMDILIISKRLTDFTGIESKAPSLISTMIAMFLSGGAIPENNVPILGSAKTQITISTILVLLTLIAIPVMLLPKPIIVYYALKAKALRNKENTVDVGE